MSIALENPTQLIIINKNNPVCCWKRPGLTTTKRDGDFYEYNLGHVAYVVRKQCRTLCDRVYVAFVYTCACVSYCCSVCVSVISGELIGSRRRLTQGNGNEIA